MSAKTRFPYIEAVSVAGLLLQRLADSCERIVIAGSVRRQKSNVGDIELLCIPKPTDNVFYADALDEAVKGLIGATPPLLAYRPNVKGSVIYGPLNKLLIDCPSGIALDLFSTSAQNWGMALLVRTGSAEFNIRVMSRFKALGMQGHADGGVTAQDGTEIPCPTEEVVFELLRWPFIPPEERK